MRVGLVRLLWLCAAALAIGVGLELAWPDAIPAGPRRAAVAAATNAGSTAVEPVSAWVGVALERPLFTPGRRPAAPGAAPAEAPVHRPEPPRLAGIMMSAAERRAIFAAPSADNPATVVGEGGDVGPWRVEAIREGEVQLAGPDGRRILRPSYSDVPAAPPPPLPPLGAGGLLPPPQQTDTKPFNLTSQPSGAAIFLNAPVLPAARTPR